MKLTYKQAGVDIDKQNRFIDGIKPIIKSTFGPEVLGGIGGFAGLFRFDAVNFKDPILVSSTDGVGTKLKIAAMADKHDGVGIDLVAMVVNDLIVEGAHPLFFLDYLATGKLDPDKAKTIIAGIAGGCKEAGCALIGGETAEMPGFYRDDEYDLAGFGVGVVDADNHIDGSRIARNDVIIGINSSGLHSNGFSLVRKVFFDKARMGLDAHVEELGKPLGEELLTPTRIYAKSILNLLRDFKIKGIAHITGGGFLDNIPRILPDRSCATIDRSAWEVPPIFQLIKEVGGVEDEEMFRTFNMGIGMILIVAPTEAEEVLLRLKGLKETARIIGSIDQRAEGGQSVIITG
ncbi:MAG TPA: phosphoribosylformylglycinamidine cyclo-ligase [Deltaproteobacteria bacterium]|nr:phosphoribosylformylglycinamidine cyclo-ligase [Deltaproteobacteria bacterium]